MENIVNRRTALRVAAVGAAGVGLAAAGGGTAAANATATDLIALRRDLHRHPEPAGAEVRTAGIVARRLTAAGLEVRTGVGGNGVVGVLRGSRPGRTVAYRADLDAVPPQAQVDGGPQVAHVCGHDLHTTIGVGVATALARRRRRLAGTVVFVFQPAEETLTGARAMLADDVFRDARPAEIHGVHCMAFPVGRFLVMPGFGLPGQDQGTVTVADPDTATRIAAEINALGTVSRPATPDDIERLVADVQVPNGPLVEFVAMQAQATGSQVRVSYRCWPEERYHAVRADVRRLATTVAGTVAFPAEPFPALVCPEPDGRRLQRHLERTFGREHVGAMGAAIPVFGDDFAVFLDRLPGTYTLLGVRRPGAKIETSFPHNGAFDPDERAIGYGVRAMTGWLASRAERRST